MSKVFKLSFRKVEGYTDIKKNKKISYMGQNMVFLKYKNKKLTKLATYT